MIWVFSCAGFLSLPISQVTVGNCKALLPCDVVSPFQLQNIRQHHMKCSVVCRAEARWLSASKQCLKGRAPGGHEKTTAMADTELYLWYDATWQNSIPSKTCWLFSRLFSRILLNPESQSHSVQCPAVSLRWTEAPNVEGIASPTAHSVPSNYLRAATFQRSWPALQTVRREESSGNSWAQNRATINSALQPGSLP